MRYARPSVYIERTDANRQAPVVLRTDIAGFVGIAARGPLDTPVAVESFRQFIAHFGGLTGAGYLAYAARGFFDNGGRRCWIVRVANRDEAGGAQAASATIADVAGQPALRMRASSAGVWGDALSLEWGLETGASVTSVPSASTRQFATVNAAAGFERGQLVRIEQPGGASEYRVLALVESAARRLHWAHPEPGHALPTDRALQLLDPSQALRISRVAYSLTVRESGQVRAVYRDLHLAASHPRFIAHVLPVPNYLPLSTLSFATDAQRADEQQRTGDLPRPAEPVLAAALALDAGAIPLPLAIKPGVEQRLSGGRDGLAALSLFDFIGAPSAPEDSDFSRQRKQRGLQALAAIDEIALVAMPDILIQPQPDPLYEPLALPVADPCVRCPAPPERTRIQQPLPAGELPPLFDETAIAQAQAALVEHCELRGDRFAVLSLPFTLANTAARSREDMLAWRGRFDTRYGALYAPWIDVVDARTLTGVRRIPACGHVLGAVARIDIAEGVHRAPANLTLLGVTDLSRSIGDEDHGPLNEAGVNAVRAESGRPPTIAGARSLSHDPDWRFVNVVRLLLAIKKGIDITLRWVVFEPNHALTRAAVAAALTGLLQLFFERGAFRGATAAESYFIRCDEVTTPPQARELGQLIALVGIAPAAPCEFVVLRVGREGNALSISLFDEAQALHA